MRGRKRKQMKLRTGSWREAGADLAFGRDRKQIVQKPTHVFKELKHQTIRRLSCVLGWKTHHEASCEVQQRPEDTLPAPSWIRSWRAVGKGQSKSFENKRQGHVSERTESR